MIARQLTVNDCQAVADLETQLFYGRFDAAGLCALLGKPAFYGAVLPAPDMPTTIYAYCLAYITSMQADIIAIGTEKTKQGRGFGQTRARSCHDSRQAHGRIPRYSGLGKGMPKRFPGSQGQARRHRSAQRCDQLPERGRAGGGGRAGRCGGL